MLKMYQSSSSHSGNSPDFWEENWAASKFEESVRFMAVDPLRPLFDEYLKADSLMLEGGCGMGNYIAYYASRGYSVIGLDFAQQALKTLSVRQPDLKLIVGDVSRIPFQDKTFDLYYSGGVVEHFESGAIPSLLEARRVLKDDGVLLISVPYYSPLRRVLTSFRKDEWRTVKDSFEEPEHRNRKFFQYAYTKSEFTKMLSDAGLKTIKTQGYAVLWGIQDISFFRQNGSSEFPVTRGSQPKKVPEFVDVSKLSADQPRTLTKRLVVSEDSSVPILGLGVKVMRWAAANMMMYVCKRI